MSNAAKRTRALYLVEVQWPDATYRMTTAGGPVIYGGQTWHNRADAAGMIQDPGTLSESAGEHGNRDLTITLTATTIPWVLDGKADRIVAIYREGSLDVASGVVAWQSVTWTGYAGSWTRGGQRGELLTLTLATAAKYADIPNDAVTYSPTFQDQLVSGDLAFDLTGARVADPLNGRPGWSGQTGGGTIAADGRGGIVGAEAVWRGAADTTRQMLRDIEQLGG